MHLRQVAGGTSNPSYLAHRLGRLQHWQCTKQPGDADSKIPISKLCFPELLLLEFNENEALLREPSRLFEMNLVSE